MKLSITLVSKYAPLIFINSCDSDNGKLFSILHELAHVWVGENSFYNAPIHANFEILIPTQMFLQKWDSNQDKILDKLEKIAKTFRCSRFVVVRKALDCGKISQKAYEHKQKDV